MKKIIISLSTLALVATLAITGLISKNCPDCPDDGIVISKECPDCPGDGYLAKECPDCPDGTA
ncbi:MAG: hypothetical protein RMJ51_01065 [Candidatus Calescibacterium sp.]|nr:hypothetical protein [Candidatus Calescibacterium sp.]MCX7972135.1 hypothetical protein [bacterium]MDW8194823.1 hypothetical protein [Candidatus Calescibacterium sp.]